MTVVIFIVWLALCGVAGYVAASKGRSGIGLFFLAFFLSPLIGIIVAFALTPNATKVAVAQGKKKCPNCAEFVQPEAKTCRFCQHTFVEEEAAERERQQREFEARLKASREADAERLRLEAEKPWIQRNKEAFLLMLILLLVIAGVLGLSLLSHNDSVQYHPTSDSKPAVPDWAAKERSSFPQSVWVKRVAWAARHHCYFEGMSRDEIVRTLGQPTEEQDSELIYKRQTKDCTRYQGDTCVEYRTEENYVWLQGGYGIGGFYPTPQDSYEAAQTCHTLFGEHEYDGLEVPNFKTTGKQRGGSRNNRNAIATHQTSGVVSPARAVRSSRLGA